MTPAEIQQLKVDIDEQAEEAAAECAAWDSTVGDGLAHSFTITLAGVDCVNDEVEERIYGVIDDALLFSSNGETRLDFDRDAPTLAQARASAVRDIRRAGYVPLAD